MFTSWGYRTCALWYAQQRNHHEICKTRHGVPAVQKKCENDYCRLRHSQFSGRSYWRSPLLPFTGVLKPTALAACLATHKKRIGIIGTTATIKSGSYQKAILEINPDIQVFAQDCPLFVPLVENGFTSPDSDIVLSVIKHYLQPFMDADIDTLILGCTHYPILYHAIERSWAKVYF